MDEISRSGLAYIQTLYKAGRIEDAIIVLTTIKDPKAREIEARLMAKLPKSPRSLVSVPTPKLNWYLLGFGIGFISVLLPALGL